MIFTIKKGKHFSNNFLVKFFSGFTMKTKRSFNVMFNESAIYVDNTEDRYDVNKLFGFSNGMHHRNSYRFAWNVLNGKLRIYAYTYVNGVRDIQDMGVIDLNKRYRMTIRVKGNKVIYTITDTDYNINQVIVNIPDKSVLGYYLWPYFGGNKTAPQKITILMEENFS